MPGKIRIMIVTIKPWNIANAQVLRGASADKYVVLIVKKRRGLNFKAVKKFNPRYIFFPHWSWLIPEMIFKNYRCIVFHMTDLPFGRGGSPLQNLILRKIYNTKICAIDATEKFDSGDVYLKQKFNIKSGSAQDIFKKASEIIFFKMIPYILEKNPIPYKQKGVPTTFKRRSQEDSDLRKSGVKTLNDLYDFIRMLDVQGYPKAYFKMDKLKIEFSQARKDAVKLTGKFEVAYEK